MDVSIQKTISFLLFIALGIGFQWKFKNKAELNGLKKIILNLALPATIFLALLHVELSSKLLLLPVMALALNGLLFFILPLAFPLVGITKGTPKYATAKLLMASLAPGLSCFPFVAEFLGDAQLAKVAMADLGNKVFVLFIAYIVVMRWFYQNHKTEVTTQSKSEKIKSLAITMISEPVNLLIVIALLCVASSIHINDFPSFLQVVITRIAQIMTPLVLLYIGLSVAFKRKQLAQILGLLLFRSGFVLLLTAIVSYFTNVSENILLIASFGLSACSFWPFAHIATIDAKETSMKTKTFDADFGINILALSFPISTVLILGILSSGKTFIHGSNLMYLGITLIVFGLIPSLVYQLKKRNIKKKESLNKSGYVKSSI